MEEQVKKKKKFKLFDTQREGKGIKKEDVLKLKPNLRGFFTYLRRDFSRLVTINVFLLFGNFPLIFAILAFSGVGNVSYSAPSSSLLATLQGISANEGMSAATASLFNIDGLHITLHAPTTTTYVLYALSALVIFTFGLVSVGTTYLIRNMLMGEPVFMFSDFKYVIRRNWKQGFLMGVLDVLFLVLLFGDFIILFTNSTDSLAGLLLGVIIVLLIIYLFMRPYLYLQLITFDLKSFKIFKNALIFSILGIKRNIMAFLASILLFILVFFMIYGLYGILIPIGLAVAVLFLPALLGYISVYAAYFKIKEIMIDPYVTEEKSELDDIKPIAVDRG